VQTRILVVDDEPDFVRFIEEVLKKENFTVISVGDGIKAIKMAGESRPDLVLLDWNLPVKTVPRCAKRLKPTPKPGRSRWSCSRCDEKKRTWWWVWKSERTILFQSGDFAQRTGGPGARGPSKKRPQPDPGEILRSGPFALDTEKRRLSLNGQEVELRPKEYELIYVFLKNEGRVLTRNFLEETIWGTEYFGSSRAIDSTVTRLRAKLGKHATAIEAVQGIGYRFEII
jgi:DNA-binding response OmpR family regulator